MLLLVKLSPRRYLLLSSSDQPGWYGFPTYAGMPMGAGFEMGRPEILQRGDYDSCMDAAQAHVRTQGGVLTVDEWTAKYPPAAAQLKKGPLSPP